MTSAGNDDWIDVTRPMTPGMVRWPGDPGFEVDRFSDMNKGDSCNVSRLVLCAHTGTHVDAPVHYLRDGAGIETMPLTTLLGPVRVIDITDPVSIRKCELEKHDIKSGERVIFKTANSAIPWNDEFRMDYVYVAADAATYLAELKVLMVGVDYMSVGGFYQDMVETHVALLSADVWVVENIDLTHVSAGQWQMICLPLKLVGCDGAPARMVMRKTSNTNQTF